MTEVIGRYRAVADGFQARLFGVSSRGWSSVSPSDGWTARAVAVHVIDTHRRVRVALGDVSFEEVDPEAAITAEWTSATDAIGAALMDESLASKTVGGMFGEHPYDRSSADCSARTRSSTPGTLPGPRTRMTDSTRKPPKGPWSS